MSESLWSLLSATRLELRHAVRKLAKSPGFVALAVLSLALGIACATFFFSVLGVLLGRPAPHVADPAQLVAVHRAETDGRYGPLSYPEMLDIRDGIDALEDAAAVRSAEHAVGTQPGNERNVMAEEVSENYFDLLGVPLRLGRGFSASDEQAGWAVAVVGHRFWQSLLGGDPAVVGRTLRIDGTAFTIVGVAPEGLQTWNEPILPDIWMPLQGPWRSNRGWQGLTVVGRMRSGANIEQVRAQLAALAGALAEADPRHWLDYQGRPASLGVLSYRLRGLQPQYRSQLVLVSLGAATAICLLLLVSCANVANLQLTRALQRRREIAVRLALGSSRARLVRQLLIESFLIAAAATFAGLLVTHWLTLMLRNGTFPIQLPVALDLTIDVRVVAFAVALAFAVAVAFGLAPALQASRPDVAATLKGLAIGGRKGRLGPRRTLVVAQVAGSLVLVVATGLLLRSLNAIQRADFGFDPTNVALLSFDLDHRQHSRETGRDFVAALSERLASNPGVTGVAAARTVMLGNVSMNTMVEEYEGGADLTAPLRTRFNVVTDGYFQVVGTPVLRGREFTASDSESGVDVAIVNQALANRLWPGLDPIGKRLREGKNWFEVVGVVRDATVFELNQDHEPHLWVPFAQRYVSNLTVHVRTAADPRQLLPALRAQLMSLDGELPVLGMDLMEDVVARKAEPQKVTSVLLGAAGAVTLGLALMGVYGVMTFLVGTRTREMGIRIALGARPGRLLAMMVLEGSRISGIGLAVGVALAAALAPLLSIVLYGVNPVDPLTFLIGTLLLLATSTLACVAPALRAARVDPAASLRAE